MDLAGTLREIADCSVLSDDGAVAGYVTDWTGRWRGGPAIVARPRTVAAVAAVMAACARAGVAVVPQGGNTGLVAGSVPPAGAVVLSLSSLDAIGEVTDGAVTAGAGVTLAALESFAAARGLTCGLSLASGESATVGGAAATNAGGAEVLRYGSARARIAGLRAVLSDGAVLDRRRPPAKDNTGYDLVDQLVGSEGTLAVITDVTWRLDAAPGERTVLVLAFPSVVDAVAAVPALRGLPGLLALEWSDGAAVARVAAHLGAPAPLPTDGCWVFAEFDGAPEAAGVVAGLLPDNRIAVGAGPEDRIRLWRYRARTTEAVNAAGVPVKLDVGVPLEDFAAAQEAIVGAVAAVSPDVEPVLFGHLAEGNVHVNLLPGPTAPARRFPEELAERLEAAVLGQVLAHGGTVSAEHGIGRAKVPWLARQRGADQVALMRRLKGAWDPSGLLNPGVLFDG
ncbi:MULTISPECIES: FAD-binding oxidoreductase [Tsukamurella]|uniref:FAD-binding oxidoreductase n=2 Tax=Tsukamurella TaxID=2060 RepID=A0A5C5RWI5_9ACTN|nr:MULTISPECIES: FAD-binding oxidoreductase [Tsukamurella]NMD57925.1 FAD-binding oxidoreductase [Tsukamurella columbiensis]TWS26883.1 FAD-binding oxidoreductase [Tsukamurella conjunctivitidis]